MRRRLRTIKERLGIPSGRAIIHIIIVEFIINFIWDRVSAMFSIEWIREIGFLVLVVAGLFAVAWYLPKLSPRWTGAKKDLGTSARECQFTKTPSLLEQILEDDKVNMSNRVYGRDYTWEFRGLKEPDAFIELIFTLINAAVFPIDIMGTSGRFLIEEHECAQEVEYLGSKRIPHGDKGGIRIKQRLTTDMANLIKSKRDLNPTSRTEAAKKGKANISLKDCKLLVSPEIDSGDSKPIPFTIGGDYEVNIS